MLGFKFKAPRLGKLIEQHYNDNEQLIKKAEESEKHVKQLLKSISQEIIHILQIALGNNASTLIDDLDKYIEQLKILEGKTQNQQIRTHAGLIILKSKQFREEFVKLAKEGLFHDSKEKIISFLTSMKSILEPLSEDLKEELNFLERVQAHLQRA